MIRFPLQSLSRLFLVVVGALLIADMIANDEKEEKQEKKGEKEPSGDAGDAAEAKAEEAAADDDKDVEGDAVVEE